MVKAMELLNPANGERLMVRYTSDRFGEVWRSFEAAPTSVMVQTHAGNAGEYWVIVWTQNGTRKSTSVTGELPPLDQILQGA